MRQRTGRDTAAIECYLEFEAADVIVFHAVARGPECLILADCRCEESQTV